MRFIWDKVDVVPGRKVRVPVCNEVWMIGYDPRVDGEDKFCLSSMNDGMISFAQHTRAEIAGHLNESGYAPLEMLEVNPWTRKATDE